MPSWTLLGTWWVFPVFFISTYCGGNGPLTSLESFLAVVETLHKPVVGLSGLLDPFGDMVGVFCFFHIYALWWKWPLNQPGVSLAVVESLTKP